MPVPEEPFRPKLTEPPAGIVSVQDSWVARTCRPSWVTLAFQAEFTFWSPGKANSSFQPLTGAVPVLRTVTSALNEVPQSLSR
ncbi:hypothetical protein SFUMM280S_10197 [Streptomyces fumanus]